MDPIKEAFSKAKQDIFNLQSQIELIKNEVTQIKLALQDLLFHLSSQQTDQQTDTKTGESPIATQNPTDSQADIAYLPMKTTQNPTVQHIPTDKSALYALKPTYIDSSIGNRGVPTDRQTDQQTDRISRLEHVSSILDSLDSIKKELRTKFKHLTKQEMTVFSLIYDLENQGFIVDYPLLSSKLSLSESSIRDYVQKIVKKGIPIVKIKENNKKILLKIDENLKQIAPLQTIRLLRDI